MKQTIYITDCDHENVNIEREVTSAAGYDMKLCHCVTEQDVIEQCEGAVALLNQYAPLNKTVFAALPTVKFVIRYGVGVDNVNLGDATAYGVQVCNVPDYGMNEVADHAFALMLALLRKLPRSDREVHSGLWDYRSCIPIHRISELTVGVLGLGRIGSAFAQRTAPFGCHLIGHDVRSGDAGFHIPDGMEMLSFEELLSQSDVLSIHCNLDESSRHMFNEKTFQAMKPGAYLINVSRGGIIDESALKKALEEKWIAGAGLDVLEREPMEAGHFLTQWDNVILTPHIAWYSEEAAMELKRKCAEEAIAFLEHKPIRYPVNTPAKEV